MAQGVKRRTEKQPGKKSERRPYRSELRTQQARETRRAIRDAAGRLFVENGYGATSITAIAEAAGVAPETVYATFKNKRALLKDVIDVTIAGDDEPIAVADRPWLDEVPREQDQRRRLSLINADGFLRVARVAPVMEVLRSAAASDPDLAAFWDEMQRQRRDQVDGYLELIAEAGPLRGAAGDLADLVWAVGGSEVHHALVVERGWSQERYIAAMSDLVERVSLPGDTDGNSAGRRDGDAPTTRPRRSPSRRA
jgi:AcrR family transcriptional regulator